MKTLKKQWLEILSTYQYVLCFCFLGKGIRAGVQLGRWEKGRVEGGRLEPPLLDHQGKERDMKSQSCPTLPDLTDCSLRGFSVHRIFQARILECASISFSGDLPESRIEPGSPALQTDALPSEPLGKPRAKGGTCQSIAGRQATISLVRREGRSHCVFTI